MAEKVNISVALATFNEAENLERCLDSVVGWVREIVVVDGGSTDGTLEIAKKFGAKIIRTDNPPIFHINKQKALDACRCPWILQLDADEVVPAELASEIQRIIKLTDEEIDNRVVDLKKLKLFYRHQALVEARDGKIGTGTGDYTAFFVPRKNHFLGHPMTYSGTYPDGVIRLVQKGKAHFPVKSVHEQIQTEGRVGWLYHDLLHFSNPTFRRYWSGADKYTNLMANELKVSNRKGLILFLDYVWLKPPLTFLTLFIRYKGILDGWYGFLFDVFSSLHYPIAYLKYLGLARS